jgi:hypothetical protein
MVSKNVTSSDFKKMHASVIVAQKENDENQTKPNSFLPRSKPISLRRTLVTGL